MAAVDEIKSRLDILDVVSRYTNLQRSGRSYKAVCPFHTEKTPSFFVFPERQSWRCFGACATGGDIFSFIIRIENLDFSEALKRLAQQAGVDLRENKERKSEQDILYGINEATREYFSRILISDKSGSQAMDYVRKRGITQNTIDNFQLGLSPNDGESLKRHLTSKGYTQEQMALAGVVTQGQREDYRDLFRGRLMFPIRDAQGRLAGFGGRALDNSNPKYLNSPRSSIFDKSRILYALHLAKESIREKGAVIVEGYTDAIIAHQAGFSNVVASMGTALTQQQVSVILSLVGRAGTSDSKDVVLALDPDAAGQAATLRSLESSWNVFQSRLVSRTQGTSLYERPEVPTLKVAALPQGKDPDEIILESPEEWANLISNAVPLIDYLFTALSSRFDLNAPSGKSKLAELLFPLITATPDPFDQDHYFQRLATLLGVSEATLQASLGRPKPGAVSYRGRANSGQRKVADGAGRDRQGTGEAAATPFAMLDHDPLEEYCLTLLFQHNGPAGSNPEGGPESGVYNGDGAPFGLRMEYFQRAENREVFTNWIKCSTLDRLKDVLDEELKSHLDYLAMKTLPPTDRRQWEEVMRLCVRRLEERYLRELNREEGLRLDQATGDEIGEQEQRVLEVNERLRNVFRE